MKMASGELVARYYRGSDITQRRGLRPGFIAEVCRGFFFVCVVVFFYCELIFIVDQKPKVASEDLS